MPVQFARRRPTGYISPYGWTTLRDTMRSERAYGWRRDPVLVRLAIGRWASPWVRVR